MPTTVSTFPLACDIVLTTWSPPERSPTLNKPRPWVRFLASLGITPGCALTQLRDQGPPGRWQERARGQSLNHHTKPLSQSPACLPQRWTIGSRRWEQRGRGLWALRRQQHWAEGLRMSRRASWSQVWKATQEHTGGPAQEACGSCTRCAGSQSAAVPALSPAGAVPAALCVHLKLVCSPLLFTFTPPSLAWEAVCVASAKIQGEPDMHSHYSFPICKMGRIMLICSMLRMKHVWKIAW